MENRRDNIVTFSAAKIISDDSKVANLITAVRGFGYQVIDSPEKLSFNVVTGNGESGLHVVRVQLSENGWFFKADLGSLSYGSKNPLINRTLAFQKINQALEKLQSKFTGVNVNNVEYQGVWQIRDIPNEESFTIIFMLGVSRKENASPIAVIQHLADTPKATFKISVKN